MSVVFSVVALLLLVSIIRSIITSPGTIPLEKEWDMQSDNSDVAESEDDEK